jgi:hypothetical protein
VYFRRSKEQSPANDQPFKVCMLSLSVAAHTRLKQKEKGAFKKCCYTDSFHHISIVNTTESVESGNNTKESNTTSNFSKK